MTPAVRGRTILHIAMRMCSNSLNALRKRPNFKECRYILRVRSEQGLGDARLAQSAERKALNLLVAGPSPAAGVWRFGAPASLPLGSPSLQLRGDNAKHHGDIPQAYAQHGETRALKSRGAFGPAELLFRVCSYPKQSCKQLYKLKALKHVFFCASQ